MESFDQSLKYLLQKEPADFIRFGLDDPAVEVLGPLASGLPSRGRDVDGSYLITRGGARVVAHIEFHRRHQSLEELAIDVAEAQIRLFRRERLLVLSQVWDLYGRQDGPVIEKRTLRFGVPPPDPVRPSGALPDDPAKKEDPGSQSVYLRVNLRGIGWEELLSRGPPALWPLVTLTRDGATGEVVQKARDAIEARTSLSSAERADHLAVLWFVAEAESVPAQVMKALILEERLMASTLYQSIFEKGEARGYAETIIQILIRWVGPLDPDIRERLRTLSDMDTVKAWHQEALYTADAEGARRLTEKIKKATLP